MMDLHTYDKYFKNGKDGVVIVIKETPDEVKSKLKEINKQYKALYEADMFIFEE